MAPEAATPGVGLNLRYTFDTFVVGPSNQFAEAASRAVVEAPLERVPQGLWCYRVDRKRSLLGGALTEGGNFFNWLRGLLKLEGKVNPEETLLGRQPGSHGLSMMKPVGTGFKGSPRTTASTLSPLRSVPERTSGRSPLDCSRRS